DLDRVVALKELAGPHSVRPLSHPNIVAVHDAFEHDGTSYIAMEYIEGGSLRPYVGKLGLEQIGGVLEGVLAGLAHAHEHGVIHGDLKPENVMVTGDGRVKIADFGIATEPGADLHAVGSMAVDLFTGQVPLPISEWADRLLVKDSARAAGEELEEILLGLR